MRALLIITFLFTSSVFAQDAATPATEASPLGKWRTIDDKTGKPRSEVEITETEGVLRGVVIGLFRAPEQDQNPTCKKCDGPKKDQPIKGMEILWGVKKDGANKWAGGKILDPNGGNEYKVKMEMLEGGDKMKVRGFLGISLLGRTQTWERVK